jgi:hypothetical protein
MHDAFRGGPGERPAAPCPSTQTRSLAESLHVRGVRCQVAGAFAASHPGPERFQRRAGRGGSPFKNCSRAARTISDLLCPRCFAARLSFVLKLAGNFNDTVFIAGPGNTQGIVMVLRNWCQAKAASVARFSNGSRAEAEPPARRLARKQVSVTTASQVKSGGTIWPTCDFTPRRGDGRPVEGPLCLGHVYHFGLRLLVAA